MANNIAAGIRIALLLGLGAGPLQGQHLHGESGSGLMGGPLGIPHTRMGSGSAWLPDARLSLDAGAMDPDESGESWQGQPLHDRQHPHILFVELAAMYEQKLTRGLGFALYGGPVGEPALGPVA